MNEEIEKLRARVAELEKTSFNSEHGKEVLRGFALVQKVETLEWVLDVVRLGSADHNAITREIERLTNGQTFRPADLQHCPDIPPPSVTQIEAQEKELKRLRRTASKLGQKCKALKGE